MKRLTKGLPLTLLIAVTTLMFSSKIMAQSSNNSTESLTPEMLLEMVRIGGFSYTTEGVVYEATYPSIKDNSFTKKFYIIDRNGTKRTFAEGMKGLSTPRWIKGTKRIAFMKEDEKGDAQLYTMNSDGSNLIQITDVEGGIEDYLFSPDNQSLLYIRSIKYGKTAHDYYPDLDKATGRIITDLMYKHWDEWVTSIPHPFLATIGNEPIQHGKDLLEGEPYEAPMRPWNGISDFAFSPDSKYIAYASRKKTGLEYSISTNSDIYLYDIASGTTRNLTEGMMGYDTNPIFSPDGKKIYWLSMERDGYESDLIRLFEQDLKTGNKRWLTEGFEYNVENPHITADGQTIYFTACINATTGLHSINVKTRRISDLSTGVFDMVGFEYNEADKSFVCAVQSLLHPTELYTLNPKKGELKQLTHDNDATMSRLGEVRCEKRMIQTTNGEKMLTWVLYPTNFDANKKYPSILYCQGGPQDPVSQFWSYRWCPRIMAEQGYIVILPNRHGVPSFGKAWNEQISGDYGGQNMQDYMSAADELKKEPYVDNDRMGCVGASYGGFSVYWLAGHHNGRFACFIAHAGIFNLESQYLETEEKWFANWDMGGAPWEKDNAVAQRTFATSPHHFVDQWTAPILVIHGERDYRILASQGMMAFDAARMRGIPCEMLIYPDETHWVSQPQNALLWQRTFFSWLDRWLKK